MKKYILSAVLILFTLLSYDASATTYTVSNNLDNNTTTGANQGDLRWCINQVNANIGGAPYIINFAIPGAAPYTVTINSPLPNLGAQNVVINATTQTGWTLNPLVIIRGSSSAINQAFQITGGTQTIKGFIFQNLQQGININGGTGHNVQNCWFGIDSNGNTRVGNTIIYQGIAIGVGTNATSGGGTAATNVTIGGPAAADMNVLSGCLSLATSDGTKRGAIQLGAGCFGTLISGNILGLNSTGTSNTNVGNGVFPYLHHNIYMLGTGTVPTSRVRITNNTISNCVGNGIWLEGGYNGTVITGNKIGTNSAGTAPMGNQAGGIRIDGSGGVPNVASDSHFIGVDEFLNVGVGNSNRNIISGNGGAPDVRNCRANAFNGAVGCGAQYLPGCAPTSNCPDKYDGTLQCGIYLLGSVTTTIANNFIGTDVTGNVTQTATTISPYNGLGNLYAGIKIEGNSTNNAIGGATASLGNVISGNGFDPFVTAGSTTSYLGHGIQLNNHTVTGSIVRNNFVGVGYDGTSKVGNRQDGISLLGAKNSTISNNTVGNNTWGIFLQSDFGGTGQANQASGNTISNNFVGTNSGLTVDLGNGTRTIAGGDPVTDTDGGGIGLQHGSYSNTISNNTGVKFNRDGIVLRSSGNGGPPYSNTISGNTVSSNDFAGIKLTQGAGANTLVGAPASANTVGGVGVGNTITTNGTYGIELDSSLNNKILANTIASNTLDGINIHNGSKSNIIGGSAAEGNTINNNGGNAIQITNPNAVGSTLNAINRNSIYCNTARGIVLNGGNAGITATVTGSPNSFTVTSSSGAGGWIEIFLIDTLCHTCPASGNAVQGKTLVAAGASPFTYTPSGIYAGLNNTRFTATASSADPSVTPAHNTSEFTSCTSLCTTPTPSITGTATVCDATNGVVYSTAATGNTFVWTVPAGATVASGAGTNSITVNFAAGASSGNVSVTETNGACNATANFAVTVNPRPVTPGITGSNTVCDGTAGVVYSVTATAGNTYAWTVPTGATITSGAGTNSITVSFAAGASSGNITVTQTTTATTCTDLTPSTFAVTVNPRPVTPAITGNNTVCDGTTGVVYSVTATAGNTYAWTVPTGATIASGAGTNSITVDFAAGASSGNITVTQTTTASSCADLTPSTFAVTVNPRPVTPGITGSNVVCDGTAGVVYSVTATAGNTYAWTVPTGATITSGAGTNSITVSFAAGASSGNITVTQTTTASSCADLTPSTFAVTVNPRPVTPGITGSNVVCDGTTGVVYSVTATAGNTYAWTVPTGATITSGAGTNSITVDFAAGASSGNITVTQTTTGTSCSDLTPSTFAVTVNPRPVTPGITGSNAVCDGTTGVVYSVTATAGNTYAWTVPTGATIASGAGTNSITVDFAAGASSGNITVTQTTTASSCSDLTPSTFAVTVNPRPVTPSITGSNTVCDGTAGVVYSVTATAGNTYAWTVPTGATITSGAGTNSITVSFAAGASSGNITVTQTTTASSCADLSPSIFAVTVNPRPVTPGITGNNTVCDGTNGVVYSVTATAGNTYAWTVPTGATITSGAGTNSITVDFAVGASSGNITVTQTTTATSCGDLTPSTFAVVVNPRPVTPGITGSNAVCINTNGVVYSVPNTVGATYVWTVPGTAVIASGQNTNSITVNFPATATSGNITVTQTTTATSCSDLTPSTFAVTVNSSPTPLVITGPNSVCDQTNGLVYSVSNNSGSTYAWTVPTGATIASGAGTSSITVNFATGASSGSITVTETNSSGCGALTPASLSVTVNPRPVTPGITGSNTVCDGTTGIVYSVTATAGNTYAWTVPTGATITGGAGTNSITVDFGVGASSGNVTVTQTTTASSCSDLTPSTFAVTVNPRPVTPGITGSNIVCDGTTGVVYSVTATAGNTYAWTVPTGATVSSGAGTNSITVDFAAGASSGNISVTQTTTATSCADLTPSIFAVTVNPRPVTPSITGSNAVCDGTTGVVYSVTSTAGNTYAWTVPTGATIASGSGTNSITVDFAAGASSGNVTVAQTTTATSCADLTPSTFAVIVNPRPVTPGITGTNALCDGTNGVSYSVTATAGSTYAWTLPAGATIASGAGTNAITVDFALGASSGNISVTQTVTASSCADLTPSTFAVTVNPTPGIPNISSIGSTTFCEGGSVVLMASSSATGTFQWKLNGTNIATGSSYTATDSGNYTIIITTSSPANCVSPESAQMPVKINLRPITPGVTGNNAVCAETNGVTYSVTNRAGSTYAWTVPGTATIATGQGTNSITVDFPATATSGSITVTETVTATGCSDLTPSAFTVTINQRPVTAGVTGSNNVCTETNGVSYSVSNNAGSTYVWTVPGTASVATGQGTSSITVDFPVTATSGDITVTETITASGCADLTPSAFTVTINQRPVTQGVTGLDKLCAETNGVSYSVPNTAGSTYVWTVPGTASVATGQGTSSITVDFPVTATSGDITVTETVTATGCADLTPSAFTVTINQRPVTQNVTGTNGLCAPTPGVAYSVPNTAGSTYAWTVPGSATIASGNGTNSITVDFPASATSGNITVTETITLTGCVDLTPSTFAVTINPQPTAPVVKSTDTTVICSGGSVHLKIVSSLAGVTQIQWSDANGIINGATTDTYVTSTAGNYSVTITTTGTCSATSVTTPVIVNLLPQVVADPLTGPGACVGNDVTLTSNASGGSNNFYYNWSASNDPTWSRTSQNPTFKAPGVTTKYIITVQDIATNSPSCSAKDSVTLVVASPLVIITRLDSLCKGTTYDVKATVSNNSPNISFVWTAIGPAPMSYVSDAQILDPTITVPANAPESVLQYLLTVSDSGCVVPYDIYLGVNSVPKLTLSTNDTVVCGGGVAALHALVTDQTRADYTYYWLHDNQSGQVDSLGRNKSTNTAYDFSATVQAHPEANYFHVTLVDGHGCVGLSDTVKVNAYDKQDLMVPNLITPNNDNKNECFIIKDLNNFDILPGSALEIYNRWGEAVFRAKNYSNLQPWCGSSLTDGVYYYHIKTGCGEQVIKGWIQILSNEAKF